MLLTLSSRKESDAKQKCLLNDEHKHTRQHEVAISTCGIEDWDILKIKRLRHNLCLTAGISSTLCNLYLRTHVHTDILSRHIDCLIGQHITHITIYADMSLFMTTYCRGEISREIEYAIGLPMSYMILSLTNTTRIVSYAYIR